MKNHKKYNLLKYIKKMFYRLFIIILFLNLFHLENVYSITVKEEEEISIEFLKLVKKHFKIIKDPYIDAYINKVGRKIEKTLPKQPFPLRFYVIENDVYNAFAGPAGHIFMFTGLIAAMKNEHELAGILAHEIAHITCRHVSEGIDRSKKIAVGTIVGLIAGILLGASGESSAGAALSIGSLAGGQSINLTYSRENERQADEQALNYLIAAKYNLNGIISILEKMRRKDWFGSDTIPTYYSTHPGLAERISYISSHIDNFKKKKIADIDPVGFNRFHTMIIGNYSDINISSEKILKMLKKNPEDPMTNYGYGLILSRSGKKKEAVKYMQTALLKNAFDPFILKDIGKIYYYNGQYRQALSTLEGASSIITTDHECSFYIAQSNKALGNLNEAASLLEKIIKYHHDYDQAYYSLGGIYGKLKIFPEAHYYLGIYYYNIKDIKNAQFHLKKAYQNLIAPDKKETTKQLLEKINKKPILRQTNDTQEKIELKYLNH